MNPVLDHWNALTANQAAHEVLPCNGSLAWAKGLCAMRPFGAVESLLNKSAEVWLSLSASDWREAFDSHPRIGQRHAQSHSTATSLRWSADEQKLIDSEGEAAMVALREANLRYEQKFGRIFIVCASEKTMAEIFEILEARLHNDDATELRESAGAQLQITRLRLLRWLEAK